jgi:hypothetical protein
MPVISAIEAKASELSAVIGREFDIKLSEREFQMLEALRKAADALQSLAFVYDAERRRTALEHAKGLTR